MSLGEGACSEGEFWESLNTACRLGLPVLYVVADNGYAISVRASDQAPAPVSEMVMGIRGLHVTVLDGRDYFEVRTQGAEAVQRVRAGQGPGLIHATVTRPYSHSLSDDQKKYRVAEELDDEADHDPILLLERQLVRLGVLTPVGAQEVRAEANELVAAAAKEALAAARPDPASISRHLVGPCPVTEVPPEPPATTGDPVAFGEAIRLTLHEEMARDERVRVFGEDVADADRACRRVPGRAACSASRTAQTEFGIAPATTPRSPKPTSSAAIGQGTRAAQPRGAVLRLHLARDAADQSEAATLRWRRKRSAVRWSCPIGGYLTGGSIWHSQCGESIFAHVPGWLVAFPSRARDAVGLLRTAFRYEDPVLFLEHKHLYRQGYNRDPIPPADWLLPFGKGAYITRGERVTVVTYGATVHRAEHAAREIDPDGGAVEIGTCGRSCHGTRTSSPSRWRRRAACSFSTRTPCAAGSAPRSRRGSRTSASRISTRPSGASPRSTRRSLTSRRSSTRCSRRSTTSPATCAPYSPTSTGGPAPVRAAAAAGRPSRYPPRT